ncbi:unnamed protein product [Eruca vesicaria subsp. sativa]|uniref:Uncharacterized protein n=1 Tax=Eruca vesicaria subsp. sativa TaxID=29727 RepID=A0ABC8ISK5_ERUVS|nr:unnamed protein product [Eruca vesicaria subsp. sativa]
MQFALGRSASKKIHHSIFKAFKVELKGGFPDQFTHELEPFLRKQVKWIPANNPFATTVNDIDQDFAQKNVYQKDGVPFWLRAEHEAIQRKLDALQNEKLNNLEH